MFTTNYYRLLANYVSGSAFPYQHGLVMYDGSINNSFTQPDPQLWRSSSTAYAANMNAVTSLAKQNGGVMFGDGDTSPTTADYKLAGNVIDGLTATITRTVAMDNNGFSMPVTYAITNSNSEAVTIKEVGIIASKGQWEADKVLLERTVLDAPVTIPAGGVGQIVYTIELPFQTA